MLFALFLDYNKLISIPNITQISHTLQKLRMNNNQVSDISMLHENPFPRLEHLLLSNNRIQSFPYPKWGWPRLFTLILDDNFIISLTHELFSKGRKPLTFSALNNLWNCGQDLCWLAQCTLDTSYELSSHYRCGKNRWMLYRTGLVCASPPAWMGLEIALAGNTQTEANKHTNHVGYSESLIWLMGIIMW